MISDPVQIGLMTRCAMTDDGEPTPWLVLADWLEEHGDPGAEILRNWAVGVFDTLADTAALTRWRAEFDHYDSRTRWVNVIDFSRGLWRFRHGSQRTTPLPSTPPSWPSELRLACNSPTKLSEHFTAYQAWLESPWVQITLEISASLISTPAWTAHVISQPRIGHLMIEDRDVSSHTYIAQLANLPELHTLSFTSTTAITDEQLRQLATLPNLRALHVRNATNTTSQAWAGLAERRPLHTLSLHEATRPPAGQRHDWVKALPLARVRLGAITGAMLLPAILNIPTVRELILDHRINTARETWLRLGNCHQLERLELVAPARLPVAIILERLRTLPRLKRLRIGNYASNTADFAGWEQAAVLEELEFTGHGQFSEEFLRSLIAIPTLRTVIVPAENCDRYGLGLLQATLAKRGG